MIRKEGFDYIFDDSACKNCGARCCKGSGYVFLDESDIESISRFLNMYRERFLKLYTKKVEYGKKIALIDLKIGQETRCVFLDDRNMCEIYPVRPRQCREFPFWKDLKKEFKKLCPGIIYAGK